MNENNLTESNSKEQEENETSTKKVKISNDYTHKYIDKRINYRCTYVINEHGIESPQSVICHSVFTNASLKPNRLLRYLEINHNEYKNKYTDFF